MYMYINAHQHTCKPRVYKRNFIPKHIYSLCDILKCIHTHIYSAGIYVTYTHTYTCVCIHKHIHTHVDFMCVYVTYVDSAYLYAKCTKTYVRFVYTYANAHTHTCKLCMIYVDIYTHTCNLGVHTT